MKLPAISEHVHAVFQNFHRCTITMIELKAENNGKKKTVDLKFGRY